ncbi:condensation domain-containing protein, partial [Streptomyces albiaxialis]|uniref:condensation domain-containing protein n=1 Tax=Streptomyces albiaxialis TaxID=329523 RepID=UPI0031E0AD4F
MAVVHGQKSASEPGRRGRETDAESVVPLSAGQASLHFLQLLAPDSPAYHVTGCVTVMERFDMARLRCAWEAVSARHPVLSGVITARGDVPAQRWFAAEPPLTVRETPGIGAEELRLLATRDYERAFALDSEAPARLFVYRDEGATTLQLVLHHIAGDMSSLFLVIDDLLTVYRSEGDVTSVLPAGPDTSYARHVTAEREFLDSPRAAASRRYWEGQLAGCRFALDLPGMTAPRPVADPGAPAHVRFALDPDVVSRVRELAGERRSTTAGVLLAVFNVLLHKLTGSDDIVVGFPVEGRKSSFKRTVGHFTNSVLIRTPVTGEATFGTVLDATRAAHLDAVRHRALPTPEVLGRLTPGSATSGQSLYQVSFQFETGRLADGTRAVLGDLGTVRFAGYDTHPVPVRQQVAQLPLRLQAGEVDEGVQGVLHFDPARLDATTVAGYARLFETLVAEAVAAPGTAVASLGSEGSTPAHWSGAGTPSAGDGTLVHRSVVGGGVVVPSGVALVDGGRCWTYA